MSKQDTQRVTIKPEQAGQRIDNFLLTFLKGVPKSRIYRIVRRGEVRVNKGRIKPDYRLQANDEVRIPPIRREVSTAPWIDPRLVARLEQAIIYEDEEILIINKPSGLAVHGGSGVAFGLIEALRTAKSRQGFLELVHRLDRDTSGCLLLAKTRASLMALHQQLRDGEMKKIYLALVLGRWQGGAREVNAPLHRFELQSGERMVNVREGGKHAITHFTPQQHFAHATLIQAEPITGRTHQIRVHAAHISHPIIGDEKYGDRDVNKQYQQYGLKRLFLHAHTLEFKLPGVKSPLMFKAELGEDLQGVIDKLVVSQ